MQKSRFEAFSDGVFAIIITIMVLELHVPKGADWTAIFGLRDIFLSYVLSFVNVGIYWVNHHHMIHMVHRINGRILWANLHLLFWLSLVPFTTGFLGENNFGRVPTAIYGIDLLMSAVAYFILQEVIILSQGKDSPLRRAVGSDLKGKISTLSYVISVPISFFNQRVSMVIFLMVALMWLVPDKRIERHLVAHEESAS